MVLHNGLLIASEKNTINMALNDTSEEEYDVEQDVARGAFADMILDVDRNKRFQAALKTVIARKHNNGEKAHVVDIGTGSGLLSLAAADAGADHVTAVEMFYPSAVTAEKIFKASKFSDKIELINGRSTELTDVEKKGNIIVAEVFDSELIGEGALRTMKRAHGTLAEKGASVIPSNATVWAMPVESEVMRRFNQHPKAFWPTADCRDFFSTGFDFQMSQLTPGLDFRPLCAPFVVFRFNFEDPDSICYRENKLIEFIVDPATCRTADGSPLIANSGFTSEDSFQFDCIFFWWDLDMDGSGGENCLTMAPTWFDPKSSWRDHWMQVAYFMPMCPYKVHYGECVSLICSHSEYEFRFRIASHQIISHKPNVSTVEEIVSDFRNEECNESFCELHMYTSRTDFYRMNALEQDCSDFIESMKSFCTGHHIICVGISSLIGLYAAKSAKTTWIVDSDNFNRNLYSNILSRVDGFVFVVKCIDELDFIEDAKTIHVVAEPHFSDSIYPWDNIWRLCQHVLDIRKQLSALSLQHLRIDCFVRCMKLFAMAVKFENLWKTCGSVDTALDFDLSIYNGVYQRAVEKADAPIQTFSLWEYPSIATSSPICMYCVDFDSESRDLFKWTCMACSGDRKKHDRLSCDGGLGSMNYAPDTNAIIFWLEVEHTAVERERPLRSTCALFDVTSYMVGKAPTWARGYKQGVYFLSRAGKRGNISTLISHLIEPDEESNVLQQGQRLQQSSASNSASV